MARDFSTDPFWRVAAPLTVCDEQSPPKQADVVVIGGGFTGLSCARRLAQAGRSVVVLEAEEPGSGASARNGGMIGWGHRARFSSLAKKHGPAIAREILAEARRSYEFTTSLIEDEGIDCRFQVTGRYLGAASQKHYGELAREADLLREEVGLSIEVLTKADQAREIVTNSYFGGLLMPTHGALHPGLFHAGLLNAAQKAGAQVIGRTPVTGLRRDGDDTIVETPNGQVRAKEIAFAANGYAGQFSEALRAFERRLIPLPSFIIATEKLGSNRIKALMPGGRMYVDTRSVHSYFRADPDGERILWGGRASLNPITPTVAEPRLRGHMASIFPELRDVDISHSWTGRIAYTRDTIPHIGKLDGVWFACGYCGSGVAMAPYLGWRMAEKILGTPEGATGFDTPAFNPVMPLYNGNPWFMRAIEAWHKFLDWRDGVRPAR